MVAPLAQEDVLQGFLEPGDDRLEQDERDEKNRCLEHGHVEAGDRFQERVDLPDDREIDADQKRRGEGVQDGLPRDQLGVQEAVPDHRVRDAR